MRIISGSVGSDVEIHHGETFNLVEEVYVMEDSKSEPRFVGQEVAFDGNDASKNHLPSIATETVFDPNLPSASGLLALERHTEHLHSAFSNAGAFRDPPLDICDTSAGNICDDIRTPRNLSPVSEESAGDNATVNTDPATRTYVSYSTPSFDDVTMVEATSERCVKPDVTDVVARDSRTHVDTSRHIINNTAGIPHPLQYQHFVVVAIDIGTTYSGYAFCFTRDPDSNIHMMRKWEGRVVIPVYIVLCLH
jgi:hypothetical protein